ncbi:hypothetical protein ColTof4_11460 [Colletotrichum tofieldiae]|uniref:Life-span regulatory factor n=1 Tax=Colletotrichum tofieldiae TaxID=708197 RepID=A0A161YB44_9PEZI|nr:hypothetical protein CT0861_08182 [Colletotrichum tofieldiae]GKT57310.1 hypothetical protein ColTof3_04649 [Colletotrichum tofieldiae]GKT79037.1 hypothetical protein ColTof4_11460 [Colletotrichum tofieldiae]GKT86738.1 hypothetical protein Ct61P_04588 [Colletotrichum tofieldiae]
MSAFDLWTHEFCLGCDKQTDGTAYCSESCRLADFEKTSTPSSVASSPGLSTPSYPWGSKQQTNNFHLSPAYDFSNAQPYGSTPARQSYLSSPRTSSTRRTLTTSSSNSSLCSMQSTTSSNTDASHLSEKAKRELQAYAVSFEQARLQRRRSA